MEKVPKFVEERLRAMAIAIEHPDPNVLTSFYERTLPERERTQVLEHLARCGACRDVIALALPVEEPGADAVRPVRVGGLTWPRLRWAVVATGVVIVGSFGVLRYRITSSHPATVARYIAPTSQQVAADEKSKPASAPSAPEASTEGKSAAAPGMLAKPEVKPQSREFDRLESYSKHQPAPNQEAGVRRDAANFRGQMAHGPKPPGDQWQQNANLNQYANNQQFMLKAPVAAPVTPPAVAMQQAANQNIATAESAPASKAVTVGGAVAVDRPGQKLDTLAMQSSPIARPSLTAGSGAEVARAKDAPPANVNASKAKASYDYEISAANGNFSPSGSLVVETARWAINSGGGLQRSFDQGKTWQEVDVSNGMGSPAETNLQLAMKKSPARTAAKEKKDMKVKAVTFRAVAANGPDVWAGGSEGNLYHSTDSGDHWVRIVPTWRGIDLTGDILSLQFADAQRGRIVTSAAEIWTTADGGQTWDKQ